MLVDLMGKQPNDWVGWEASKANHPHKPYIM
jgi:hypothetical protein